MDRRFQYVFTRSVPGIASEIYFPKKAAYQGAIFDALRNGFFPDRVRQYLKEHVAELIEEFETDWPELLRPESMDGPIDPAAVVARIEQYQPVFYGYSAYSVDGVYFDDETGAEYEETTQVLRIVFRIRSPRLQRETERRDVLLAIARWLVESRSRVEGVAPWDLREQERFLMEYSHWPADHVDFARAQFPELAHEISRWIEDCGLFVFGYLVRQFAERVLAEGKKEKEIWVTSVFGTAINVVQRLSRGPE